MSTLALDRLLAVLLVGAGLSALLTLQAGRPDQAWVFVLHGILGASLLGAVVLKLRRSLPRALGGHRWRRLAMAAPLVIVSVVGVAGGLLWVAGGRLLVIGPWTLLSWHAASALVIVPAIALHLLRHRWRILLPRRARASAPAAERRRFSRRAALQVFGLAAIGVTAWGVAEGGDRLAGGVRRFTGSRWLPAGGVPPSTTFLGDSVPALDPAAWRLEIAGRVAQPLVLALSDLDSFGRRDLRAVLDCTSGWAIDTDWSGVSLGILLDAAEPAAGATHVFLASVTGWSTDLPLAEARQALLATRVAGRPLPVANGAPCRLVAPDRRGLDWVKWVTRIEVR